MSKFPAEKISGTQWTGRNKLALAQKPHERKHGRLAREGFNSVRSNGSCCRTLDRSAYGLRGSRLI